MAAKIIDGKSIAADIREEVKQAVAKRVSSGLRAPGLAVINIGADPASSVYVRKKREACEQAGITSRDCDLDSDTTQDALFELIDELNHDTSIDGMLVQLPLPGQIDASAIIERIDASKDVDGFHPLNIGHLALRQPGISSCTPRGIMHLLDSCGETYKGRHAVIVGSSNIVGRPMMLELLLAGATVTIAHRFTGDVDNYVRQADIVVAAVGKPGLVKGDWIKPGATVIDVGVNRLDNGKLTGDVEFESAAEKAAWITPVPGGVGPMTVAVLLQNTLAAAEANPDK